VQDLRLQHLVVWAKHFLDDVDIANRQYLDQIAQRLVESRQHEKAFDYSAGIRTLSQIPESMRDVVIGGDEETVTQALTRLSQKQQEIRSTERKIKISLKTRSFDKLLPEVEKFLKLDPTRVDMLRLREQLITRSLKLEEVRDECYGAAEKAFAIQDYSGCLELLNKIDPSMDDADTLLLKINASDAIEKVQRMDRQISLAVEAKQFDGLLMLVDQYLALRSNDEQRKQLRQLLLQRNSDQKLKVVENGNKFVGFLQRVDFANSIEYLKRVAKTFCAARISILWKSADGQATGSQKFYAIAKIVGIILLMCIGLAFVIGLNGVAYRTEKQASIEEALRRKDYEAVLDIDPRNEQALAMRNNQVSMTKREETEEKRIFAKNDLVNKGDHNDRRRIWSNQSYNSRIEWVVNDSWREVENLTGVTRWHFRELSRTDEYLELQLIERSQTIRFYPDKAEVLNNGKWEWISNGKWESQ
jgi:hypothetical protein